MRYFFDDRGPSPFAKALRHLLPAKGDPFNASVIAGDQGDLDSELILRAAVGPLGVSTTDSAALAALRQASDIFIAKVRPQTVWGRMINRARQIPFRTQVSRGDGADVDVYWNDEASPHGVSRLAFSRAAGLDPKTLTAIVVITKDVVKIGGALAENAIDTELSGAVAAGIDRSFIDPTNAGSTAEPPSILYGVQGLTSSNDPNTDFEVMIGHFSGNLVAAAWVMSAKLAARLNLMRDSGGASSFPDVGADGGRIAGIPVLTSDSITDDTAGTVVALIDQSAVLYADDGVRLDVANQATIQINDAPVTDATAAPTSLWQMNYLAVRVQHTVNWERARDGSVVWMEVTY